MYNIILFIIQIWVFHISPFLFFRKRGNWFCGTTNHLGYLCLHHNFNEIFSKFRYVFNPFKYFHRVFLQHSPLLWIIFIQMKKKLYGPFSGMWFNCLKATEPLWGDSLLFTTKSPGVSGTHFIDGVRMKGWVDLESPSGFKPLIGNPGS